MAPFAIAMEAKRYNDTVPLEALAGKASVAALGLAGRIDLWVLAATVEISEPTQQLIAQVLDQHGMSLLSLDWTDTGLPPLAVLLAAARAEVLLWVEACKGRRARNQLERLLGEVVAHGAFATERQKLAEQLSAAAIGLDAFRSANGHWMERRLADRRLAQRDFSQFLSPLARPERTIARPRFITALERAVRAARLDNDTLVAVLGAEGCGKSWTVMQWWLAEQPRPILLLSAGRMADLLSPRDEPLDLLARLAALQVGRRDADGVSRWRRKLENWANWEGDACRFIILLDGLNETSGKHWATIIQLLAPTVRALGGVLLVTCRTGYWDREVAPRLGLVTVEPVLVTDYDDAEMAMLLGTNNLRAQDLSPELREFIRNPRICSLAISLVERLASVEDLSVDRLLLEYWRARLLERGDLLGHDDRDFNNLLMVHAREYRARPGIDFDRDEWLSRSGAAQRADGRTLRDDLSDIEEGRFFDPVRGGYRFRPEALHFALGLLVADEVRSAVRADAVPVPEGLERVIDEVRGFDRVADILASAIATACLDKDYPHAGIEALVASWLALQNLDDHSFDRLVPYIAERPEPFLNAFESRDLDRDDRRFLPLLILAAERPGPAAAIEARLARWLGSWSRASDDWGDVEDRRRRHADRQARIDARLAELSPGARALFDSLCNEGPGPAGLAGAAVLFMAGRPQAQLADGIVAFALAHTVAGDHRSPYDDLAWAVRLNRIDHADLVARVRESIRPLLEAGSSPTARTAAAHALRLVGSLEDSRRAEELLPLQLGGRARAEERFCATDPLDPDSRRPDNIGNAVLRIGALTPTDIWNHMSSTIEDHDLEAVTPGLARFEPAPLATFMNDVACTAATREGMPLRQLSWHLPWLSPLLETPARTAMAGALSALAADPGRAPNEDSSFVMAMIVEGLMPQLDAEEQHDLLLSLPGGVPFYLRFHALAKPLDSGRATARLEEAVARGEPRAIERTLLLLAAGPLVPDARLRELLRDLLASDEELVGAAAAELAARCKDDELDDLVLSLPLPGEDDLSWRAAAVRSAFSSGVVRRGRSDLVANVPIEHLDWVAARLPEARETLADTIEATVAQLSERIRTPEPADALLNLELSDEPVVARIRIDDRGDSAGEDPIEALNLSLSDDDGSGFTRRRALLRDQVDRFMAELATEGALAVARRPQMLGLEALVSTGPERVERWLRSFLVIEDEQVLRQLQNLGFTLAQAYAGRDAALASSVFVHFWRVEPHVTVLLGRAKLPLRALALFGAPNSPEIDTLRVHALRDAASDAALELLVLAAEHSGASDWLDRFVADAARSILPANQALAVTVASLRPPNSSSDEVLDRDWSTGFLGRAAEVGRDRYSRAGWTAHWLGLARDANDPREAWRYLELAVTAADRRALLSLDPQLLQRFRAIGADALHRLGQRADKASDEARKSLYGARLPSRELFVG